MRDGDVVSVDAGEKLDAYVHIRLPRHEKLRLRNHAIEKGRSISELVREWMAPELRKRNALGT